MVYVGQSPIYYKGVIVAYYIVEQAKSGFTMFGVLTTKCANCVTWALTSTRKTRLIWRHVMR